MGNGRGGRGGVRLGEALLSFEVPPRLPHFFQGGLSEIPHPLLFLMPATALLSLLPPGSQSLSTCDPRQRL